MSARLIIDLVLAAVLAFVVLLAWGYLWWDSRRSRAEQELDHQQEEVLQLALQLADQIQGQGFDARRALIRAVQEARNAHR